MALRRVCDDGVCCGVDIAKKVTFVPPCLTRIMSRFTAGGGRNPERCRGYHVSAVFQTYFSTLTQAAISLLAVYTFVCVTVRRLRYEIEGSEDELELTTSNLEGRESDISMEHKMIPLPNDFNEFSNNNDVKAGSEIARENLKLTLKPVEQLYASDKFLKQEQIDAYDHFKYMAEKRIGDQLNGIKITEDLSFGKARESVLEKGCLPPELEVREYGVFAKCNLARGAKYGPFQGKWAGLPQDPRFAWEVDMRTPIICIRFARGDMRRYCLNREGDECLFPQAATIEIKRF
ncbi:hypothetical protein Trydic_g15276 [Trypoxylus dichotomus]